MPSPLPNSTPQRLGPSVTLLVAGMTANTTYHMRAKVEYDDGGITAGTDQTFTTGAVPHRNSEHDRHRYARHDTAARRRVGQPGGSPLSTRPLQRISKATSFGPIPPRKPSWQESSIYPIKLLPNGNFMCI